MNRNGMDPGALNSSLKEYVDRMIRIRYLSSPDLHGVPNAEAYSEVLLENFRNIGGLAQQNRKLISEIIDPILNVPEPLDADTIAAVEKLNERLLNASALDNIDLPLVSLLTDRLLLDAEMKGDHDYRIRILDKVIENSYHLINTTKRVISDPGIAESHRQKGIAALEELMEYLDRDRFLALTPESRGIVMTNARYGIGLYEYPSSQGGDRTEQQFRMLEKALEMAQDPFYTGNMPGFDWKYQLFRIYQYLTQIDYTNITSPETLRKALEYTERYTGLWESDPEYCRQYGQYGELQERSLRLRYLAGMIPKREFLDRIYGMYETRQPRDYSLSSLDMNLELPLDYLRFTDRDNLSRMDQERIGEIYNSALAYIFYMPKLGLLSMTLEPYTNLLLAFREYEGMISFEELGIQSFAALHPPTYIHSRMVAAITRCLTENLLIIKPELFRDLFAYLELEDRPENREKLAEFAWHAALCHDFGKLFIIDTIFVYGRRLFELEFDLIRRHPDIGAALLSRHGSTRRFADVARGHHLWYDGSRGYPAAFDTSGSPLKVLIDIVAIADCMDAATDSVGRSYKSGKTFGEYEQEVIGSAGRRYAPWGPELLGDAETRKELEYLLGEGRMKLYRETYQMVSSFDGGKIKKEEGQTGC